MAMSCAARVGDPVGHTPLWGMVLKVGAGLAAGLLVGAAIGLAAVAIVGTGGLAAVALGALVGAVLGAGVDAISNAITGSNKGLVGYLTDVASNAIDSICPKAPSGAITTGSRDIHINKKPAAVTLTSLAVCSNHPSPIAAEGSGNVYFNGLRCHRKDDKVSCGGVTLQASPNVHVGGEKIPDCEIADEMPPWLGHVAQWAGIAMALCTRQWRQIPQKLLCLGIGMAFSAASEALVGVVKNVISGFPVHALTGAKFLDGADDTDFSLPGRLPLEWERRYSSLDVRADGPFGAGWSTLYSVQLKLHQAGDYPNIFVNDQGAEILFPSLNPGESVWNTSAGYCLALTPSGRLIIEGLDGLYRDFGSALSAEPHVLNLERLEDRNGNRINLHYSETGTLSRLADSAGNFIECTPDSAHPSRIACIRLRNSLPNGSEKWRVLAEYGYDSAGRLISVKNALGQIVRRFSYHTDGPGKGLMASHSLPTGLECAYEWDMFDHPRVVRINNSDGQAWNISYDIEAGRTTSRDTLGRREEWTWDSDFNLLSHTDALGQTTQMEWSGPGQPTSMTDAGGGVWKNEYDDKGMLIKTVDPLGGETCTTWDHLLMLPLEERDPAGNAYAYEYDKLGNLIRMTDPLGQVTEYGLDDNGQVCGVTDPQGGVTRLVWNDAGQVVRRVDCSGNSTSYEYNELGYPKSVTDAEGNVTTYDLDVMGQPLALALPDGGTRAFAWNTAGLLVSATDGMGGQDHLRYNQRGQVAAHINAKGGRTGYSYDLVGNLTQLRNENGEAYSFEHDAADRQVSQTGLDGISRRWTLDSMGMPVEVREAAGTDAELRVTLERDLLGRLIRKTTAETVTAYDYDPAGQLLEARREDLDGAFMDSLHLSYDAVGNLTGETTVIAEDDGTLVTRELRHEYDPLGNRTRTVLPDGECLSYALCGSGFVHQISISDSPDGIEQVITAFERDRLQRETLRTQGRRHALSDYDPLSRLTARRSRVRTDLLVTGDLTLVNKEYAYDKNGELVGLTDSLTGSQTFAYDALGRVTGSARRSKTHNAQLSDTLATLKDPGQAREALFREERFTYDETGNLLNTDGEDLPLTTFGPVRAEQFGGVGLDEGRPTRRQHNRVRRLGRFTFTHDLHGRVVEKLDQDAKITWTYRYDCEHRLIEASRRSRRGFTTTCFRYDLLGRRIVSSTSGRETRFVWNGMQLLQEQRGHQRSTFLYEPGTYAPLARIDADSREATRRMYYFHCTPAGLPEEMTDEEGRIIWRARHNIWGRPIFETTHNAPEGFRQNLRMQGQYDDRGTGLYYNTFRHYDPDTGRFTTEDPIGLLGGMNLYSYAPNPMGWVDPWGWCKKATKPSPRQSELHANGLNPNHQPQVSFSNGRQVRYGRHGSVRPDNYLVGEALEVKNYDLLQPRNRANLYNKIRKQYLQRISNLPKGTHQRFLIDIRGQNVPNLILMRLRRNILTITRTPNVTVEFMQ